MSVVDPRRSVASQLIKRLPPTVASLAHLDANVDVPTRFEPWLTLRTSHRTIEVHIREGGDVEIHEYVSGRLNDPRERLFVCQDAEVAEFASDVAQQLLALTQGD